MAYTRGMDSHWNLLQWKLRPQLHCRWCQRLQIYSCIKILWCTQVCSKEGSVYPSFSLHGPSTVEWTFARQGISLSVLFWGHYHKVCKHTLQCQYYCIAEGTAATQETIGLGGFALSLSLHRAHQLSFNLHSVVTLAAIFSALVAAAVNT